MKTIIKLHLINLFNRKLMAYITILFIFLSLIQVYLLQSLNVDHLDVNIWDFLLLSFGGFFTQDPLVRYFGWLGILLPIIILLFKVFEINTSYETFILTRIHSRFMWYISKSVTVATTIMLYHLWLFIINLFIGLIFLKLEVNWSPFAENNLPFIIKLSTSPIKIVLYTIIQIFTGSMLISLLLFNGAIIYRNSINYYALVVIVNIGLSFYYRLEMVPRKFSPFNYGSFLEIAKVANGDWEILWADLCFNMGLTSILLISGYLLIRKFSYSK